MLDVNQGHPLKHHACAEGSQRGPTEHPLPISKRLWAHLADG